MDTSTSQSTSAACMSSTCPSSVSELECEVDESQNSNTSSGTSTEVVSLLSRLRPPTSSDLGQKRKIASNPPPTGKRRSRGTTGNEPKNIQPYQRVKEFTGEHLKLITIRSYSVKHVGKN